MEGKSMESIFVKFAQYPSIETERLLLRPVTLDDAEAMFEYASDRENTRYTFPTNQSLEETKNNIAQLYLANPLGRWGIELKSNGQFMYWPQKVRQLIYPKDLVCIAQDWVLLVLS